MLFAAIFTWVEIKNTRHMKAQDILTVVEAKRGYLLPYHRMLANDDPELLGAYDALYERLTLVPRVLTPKERELVWVGLLAAIREDNGHIHMERGVTSGLALDELGDAIALAGAAAAYAPLAFAINAWAEWAPAEATTARYLALAEAARGTVPRSTAEIILSVCHAAQRRKDAERLHVVRAFEEGVSVGQMAEAMSYLLLPCGGPTLIDAVQTWADAAEGGFCPSPYGD